MNKDASEKVVFLNAAKREKLRQKKLQQQEEKENAFPQKGHPIIDEKEFPLNKRGLDSELPPGC